MPLGDGRNSSLDCLALCIPKIGFCILGMNYLGVSWKKQLPAVFLISASIFYADSDFFSPFIYWLVVTVF